MKVDLVFPVSGLAAMCSLDHGGSSFSDSQEAVNAIAHFTVELHDGRPFERIALVRHELEAVESCVLLALALAGRTKRQERRRMRRQRTSGQAEGTIFTAFTGAIRKD